MPNGPTMPLTQSIPESFFGLCMQDFHLASVPYQAPTGHIWFDSKDITQSSVEVQIPVNRLDMGDMQWNNKVLSSTYLSAEQFPMATFKSTRNTSLIMRINFGLMVF